MSFPQCYKSELLQAIESIDLESVQAAIEVLHRARNEGRRIFTCGNGGSASTASHVFVEQLKNHAEPRDVPISISGSGNSPNVLRAMECANSIGCHTIALSGRDGGKMGPSLKPRSG